MRSHARDHSPLFINSLAGVRFSLSVESGDGGQKDAAMMKICPANSGAPIKVYLGGQEWGCLIGKHSYYHIESQDDVGSVSDLINHVITHGARESWTRSILGRYKIVLSDLCSGEQLYVYTSYIREINREGQAIWQPYEKI